MLVKLIPAAIRCKIFRKRMLRFLRSNPDAGALCCSAGAVILCGMKNKIEKNILYEKYDHVNFVLIDKLVQQGHVCFDVGANIGAYSVALSKRCSPTGTVHSFEPVNHIRRKLHLNLAVNGARNVTVNDFGLGDQDAQLAMHQVKEGVFRAGTSSFVKNPTIQKMGDDKFVIDVAKIRTLDGYTAEMGLQRMDFIKIDVEGFEVNVLRGGIESIRQYRPAIILEFDFQRHGDCSRDFVEFFSLLNYDVFHLRSIGRNLVVEPFEFSFQPEERNLLCLPAG